MADSRLELAVDTIIEQLKGITQAQGYRNTVKNVVRGLRPSDLITDFPEIAIDVGRSVIKPKTDSRIIYDEITQIVVTGSVAADTEAVSSPEEMENLFNASESLAHDLKKKICTDILTTYITNSTNAFNVELSSNELVVERFATLGLSNIVAQVQISFAVRIRAQDSSFDD